MQAVMQLERLVFRFTIAGQKLSYQYAGEGQLDPAKVRPLLVELKSQQAGGNYLCSAKEHSSNKAGTKDEDFWKKTRRKKPVPLDQVELIKKLLRENGLVLIKSRFLDGEVIYFRPGQASGQKTPADAVVYTLEELRVLVDNPPNLAELRQIHEAKRQFNGTVVHSWHDKAEQRELGFLVGRYSQFQGGFDLPSLTPLDRTSRFTLIFREITQGGVSRQTKCRAGRK